MKTILYEKFKHGQRVSCEIGEIKIDDARIGIDNGGNVFICQNEFLGIDIDDKLGYKYSYLILEKNEDYDEEYETVVNLKFLPRTLDDLEEGDVVVDECGDEQKVLGICGNVYFLSEENEFSKVFEYYYTTQELKDNGYTLKQEEEEKLEFTEPTAEEKKIIDNPIYIIHHDENTIIYKGRTYVYEKP